MKQGVIVIYSTEVTQIDVLNDEIIVFSKMVEVFPEEQILSVHREDDLIRMINS